MGKNVSEIELFTKVRRIIFSTYHSKEKGPNFAFEYLETYKKSLDVRSYVGLKAELNFYHKNRRELKLTLAADVGDHTDFTGIMAGEQIRFDVTTNPDYKTLKDYEPLQKDVEAKYKIAIIDGSGNLDELVDINFPFCPECEKGRLIDTVVLLPENTNDEGESKWTNDQCHIGICNNCQYFEEYDRISTHFLYDIDTEIENAIGAKDEDDYPENFDSFKSDIILNHVDIALPYLQKQFNKSIMALCNREFVMTDKDGDGYNCLNVYWRKKFKLLDDYILDEYEIEFE